MKTISLPWSQIETVFLDMDGTLLDLHFDDFFWQHHLPRHWARKHNLDLQQAMDQLVPRFKRVEGTLDWYCLDYWSRELDVNIAMLKEDVAHLIAEHPGVLAFLRRLGECGKRRVLLTNAHQDALDLKLRHTQIGDCLDHTISAHELGLAKEEPGFWQTLRAMEPFHPQKTLFIDDNFDVLDAAREAGIAQLLGIAKPSSQGTLKTHPTYTLINGFQQIMP